MKRWHAYELAFGREKKNGKLKWNRALQWRIIVNYPASPELNCVFV